MQPATNRIYAAAFNGRRSEPATIMTLTHSPPS